MLRATLKSLAARKLRLGMSAFAIVIGVAFVVGSFVFTDTLNRTFSDIFSDLNADVVVGPATPEGQDSFVSMAGSGAGVAVPAAVVDEIAQVPGVERAIGEVENSSVYILDKDDKVVGVAGAPGIAVNYLEGMAEDGDDVLQLVDGRPPERPGEVVVDDQTIDKTGYEIGDEVSIITLGDEPRITADIVGIVRFGDDGSLAGASLVAFETSTAQELFLDGENAFSQVQITAEAGIEPEELRASVAAVLPDTLEARTGAEVDDEFASAVEEGIGFFNTFLLVFAAIALFVGVFLILNTFSILVAQRSREMALFRALGAERRQVTRSVMIESVVVGLVGGTLGLVLGLGIAWLLQVVFAAFGMDFGTGLVLQPRTVVVAYVVGVLVTMVAAFVPARRAAKIPPIAAMREDATLPESSRRTRWLIGGAVTVVGAAAMVAGLADIATNALLFVGAGVLAVFVGVALLAPIISVPIISVITSWYPRVFGTTGRLAKQNAMRNPRRTAATASALMIGLALVSAIAVVGASTKKSTDEALDDGLNADFVIANATPGQPFSPEVGERAQQTEGVDTVAVVRYVFAVVDGSQDMITALEPDAFNQASPIEMVEGALDVSGDGAIVGEGRADRDGIDIGDTVRFDVTGGHAEVTVAGIYDDDHPLLGGGFLVGLDTPRAAGLPDADSTLYVLAADGADITQVQAALDQATAELPTVTVQNREEYKQASRDGIDQMLNIVYALLGLAVLIAILGIVNTLALSVLERTREVGLLRAVGLSRRQLRRTVRLESIAIAVLGAVLGIGLGLLFGISLQQALSDDGLAVLDVPLGQLIAFVVMSAVVGVLAAVWPARRAAKLDVLRAITTE
ncbi:ABC transporter permease [Phytoactinopolyspora mesophila]|uniref:FtsX-like permease family protein n=1 Tax=Phytoactinopolyspora mesophila TaxID=2650750 RepID=A0A7K3LYP4_9ACTN|nr:FtsX-like permease family protein [Phytoactinopolyspora mesophila]NDL56110.1 FtsX-like permease family protein [Phytoactinopolyspora mesophila]